MLLAKVLGEKIAPTLRSQVLIIAVGGISIVFLALSQLILNENRDISDRLYETAIVALVVVASVVPGNRLRNMMNAPSKELRLWMVLSLCWMALYIFANYSKFDDPPLVFVGYLLGLPIFAFLLIVPAGRQSLPGVGLSWLWNRKGLPRIAVLSSGVWLVGWFSIGRLLYNEAVSRAYWHCKLSPLVNQLAKENRVYWMADQECASWFQTLAATFDEPAGFGAFAVIGVTVVAIPWIIGTLIFIVSRWIKQGS